LTVSAQFGEYMTVADMFDRIEEAMVFGRAGDPAPLAG
jgi:hypothetical protein